MKPDFNKTNGLIPAIIQNATTLQVLMLGYMNEEAFTKTQLEKRVTFYSRSRNKLWTKGETSGNYLNVVSISLDCDNDTILIQAKPVGATCHTGSTTCFGEPNSKGFLYQLEEIISERIESDSDTSYTNTLFKRGINKVAQKVGEEAVELVIEAKDNNEELFKNEAADLLYHFLILLKAKYLNFNDIEKVLKERSS
ncbi:phosphoribosyl-ATP pyrophosphatase [Flavobacterium beibuense F44-8]|uniref:Histidine biosynthesis bifunctional protein HisIE n=1 Tax=Flavobacterium beibuense F44-8 TaxID=1406840 RepID=A0A0A2LIP8_9FLAO|nr:bifunctional phosphoribosyl-AMP cyclohydrolase/phosphoribosyl-ATP diphosphatase HisIE [Flavobacterium beibuense]KGO80092.1 phosphoribosyl-ATP pyrophosphatase [Flavobacterium beibuense F44-8]